MSWPIVSLGEIAKSVDYGLTASAIDRPVGPKFLRITDIQDDDVDWATVPHCVADSGQLLRNRLADGDIVFARTGATTGKSFLVRNPPTDAVFASYLIRVRPSERLDSVFLAYFFRSPDYWGQIEKSTRGAAQPGVNASVLKKLTIPLPALEEQRRIATLLDKADDIRRKREKILKMSDRLLESLFVESFGDLVKNTKNWPTKRFGDHIVHANNGLSRRRKIVENVGEIVLRLQDIQANNIVFNEPNRISMDESEKSRFEVFQNDILFVRVNGNRDYVGRCAVFDGYTEPVFHNDHIIRLRTDATYDPYFLRGPRIIGCGAALCESRW